MKIENQDIHSGRNPSNNSMKMIKSIIENKNKEWTDNNEKNSKDKDSSKKDKPKSGLKNLLKP